MSKINSSAEGKKTVNLKIPHLKTLTILMILLLTVPILFLSEKKGFSGDNFSFKAIRLNNSQEVEDYEEGDAGPLYDIEYFKQWNYPYGMSFPKNIFNNMWNEVKKVPSENEFATNIVNSWRCIGPYGMVDNNTPARYSGRILDVEVDIANNTLVASASGGLWGFFGFIPIPLSDDLNCMAIGSFDTRPGDPNTILLGTGEYYVGTPGYQKTGTGLYKSTNGGSTWTNISLNPEPDGFSRIRYSSSNPNIVHAATVDGYYRSTNGGNNWTRILSSSYFYDIAIKPSNNNVVYLARDGALLKSTNAGLNFSVISGGGFPSSDVGRISVSLGTSNSSVVYAGVSRSSDSHMLGVFRSSDEGLNWSDVSPTENIYGNQGWYDNVIGVCPTNSNIVLAGGVHMYRTTNAGSSWTEIADDDMHSDQHAIEWKDGNTVYAGNDGGLTYSTDAGATWTSPSNIFPITQYITVNAGVNNRGVIYGGSRDNGISGTTNGGSVWKRTLGGDGGGIYVDPFDAHFIFITNGAYNGDWEFKRFKSTDYGLTWSDLNNSDIDPSTQFYTKMRGDKNVPLGLYTNSGPYVYYSSNQGMNWQKLNNTPFSSGTLSNFSVSKYSGGSGAAVYACLNSNPPSATQKLKVYDNGAWYERSGGFPSNQNVRTVAVHQQNSNLAYALINGVGTPGQKIYKTTNRGTTWVNISGNIPDVPMGDLVPHPTDNNKLYVGTQLGCYRTTNGGANWHRWNNGLPDASIITEMSYVDSVVVNNKFYVLIGTYGRSIWVRDISGDDPNGIIKNNENIPERYSLGQNYPNPFNPSTKIRFEIPAGKNKNEFVQIKIYDINGKETTTLVNQNLDPGSYTVDFDASDFSSGVYFYRIQTRDFSAVKKMILIK